MATFRYSDYAASRGAGGAAPPPVNAAQTVTNPAPAPSGLPANTDPGTFQYVGRTDIAHPSPMYHPNQAAAMMCHPHSMMPNYHIQPGMIPVTYPIAQYPYPYPAGVVGPTHMPAHNQPVYNYGYSYPHATAQMQAYPQAQALPIANTHPGMPIQYGRSQGEVARDEAFEAIRTAEAARKATENFKPTAKPEDMFWVWEKDHVTRHLYSFATIDSWKDGKWHIDPNSGIAYYIRSKEEK